MPNGDISRTFKTVEELKTYLQAFVDSGRATQAWADEQVAAFTKRQEEFEAEGKFINIRGTSIPVSKWITVGQGTDSDGNAFDIIVPIIPLDKLNADVLNEIYQNNTYRSYTTGESFKLSVSELANLGFTSGTLYPHIAFESIGTMLEQQGVRFTPDISDYLTSVVEATPFSFDSSTLMAEATKLQQYPEYAEVLRIKKKMGGELPPYWEARDIQRATGMLGALNLPGGFETEQTELEATLKNLEPLYKEWKPKYEAGIYEPGVGVSRASQVGYIAIQNYERAQQRIAELTQGIGATPWQRGVPQWIMEKGQELNVPNYPGLALQYAMNPADTQFANLTQQQLADLSAAGQELAGGGGGGEGGLDVMRQREILEREQRERIITAEKQAHQRNEAARLRQEAAWQQLLNRSQRPQRIARI